ncbi:hypothetical protein BKA93DRAFT_913479 [Sparassis latifolia]
MAPCNHHTCYESIHEPQIRQTGAMVSTNCHNSIFILWYMILRYYYLPVSTSGSLMTSLQYRASS